jgi:hypothetical protein
MLFPPKPPINLLAGWQYLFSRRYREEVRNEWQTEPWWVVTTQVAVGTCSVLFPLIVVVMLASVIIGRHL